MSFEIALLSPDDSYILERKFAFFANTIISQNGYGVISTSRSRLRERVLVCLRASVDLKYT